MTTVQAAWAAVMDDVRSLAKGDRNNQQNFSFRGVDAVMNAVGPALRKHGVSVVPTGISDVLASSYTTKSGTVMRDVFLVVSYAITGPEGDVIPGAAAGEASDAGDKATPKAMSVAYRTFLLQALTLPTDEPDPDAQTYERGAPAELSPQELALQVVNGVFAATTEAGVREWGNRAISKDLLQVRVHGPQGRQQTVDAWVRERLAFLGGPASEQVPA